MQKTQTTMTWIALVLSALAFVTAVASYNRVAPVEAGDLTREIQMQVRSLQQEIQVARIRSRLEDLRAGIEANTIATEDVQEEVAQIREDLRDAFVGAGTAARESWETADMQLAQIDENLRSGVVDILESLEEVIRKLRQDIKFG
jgi:hypothetical protein